MPRLEKTARLLWKKHETTLLDPDVADELIKQAYAFSGPELDHFANALLVPTDDLAQTIVQSAPGQPTRTELRHLMTYVISYLRDSASR